MVDTSEGHDPAGAADGDPDSPSKSSFFARLFRRETPEDPASVDPAAPTTEARTRVLLKNLRRMRTMRIEDVSIPRPDIVAVPADASIEDLIAVFRESTLSRLPVYRETLDAPLGLVHLKDLALTFGFGASTAPFDLEALIRPLLYVPPSMPIGTLLQKMQAARSHMALVIDEYGGVDGLVTIEDLLEQIVGEISDEHDDEEESQLWIEEAPDAYLVQARINLDAFEAVAGVDLAGSDLDDEVDTVGGLVFRLAGRIPERGAIVPHPDGHEFEVVEAEPRRIKRLRVRLNRTARGAAGAAAEAAE